MGRNRKTRKDLPKRVYFNHGAYFFVDRAGKWHALGKDYYQAMIKFAEVNSRPQAAADTLAAIMERYIKEVIPKKAERTQKDNLSEIDLLKKAFGHMRPEEVTPPDVYAYMDARPPVRANREKALLSHVFSYAIRWGLATDNPCRHVKRNPEKPGGKYAEQWQYDAVYPVMPPAVQVAMDIARITGLRQGDILQLKLTDCREEGLQVKVSKTGKTLLFAWTDELNEAIERAKTLPSKIGTMWLIHTQSGQPYTGSGFRTIWQRTIRKAMADKKNPLPKGARFAFKDLRTTAGTDSEDEALLGHQDKRILHRHYKVKPTKVTPIKPPKKPGAA